MIKWIFPKEAWERRRGPFSIQGNNQTREFEYPWAFHATSLSSGMKVVEIGGSLSGFQFILSKAGCKVVNVDPGLEAAGVGWPCDNASLQTLNTRFGTDVELRNTVIEKAGLESEAYDRFFSISVLEHLPEDEIGEVFRQAFRCLRPGGLFVMTVDLFLNLKPFTDRDDNEFGTNRSVSWMLEQAPFELTYGNKAELYGFPEFNSGQIQRNLENYLVGTYPALVQCVVLRKSTVEQTGTTI